MNRVVACLPYFLPFLNAFSYGRFLISMWVTAVQHWLLGAQSPAAPSPPDHLLLICCRYPAVKTFVKPFLPTLVMYHSIPFGSLIAFFGLYVGVVNNRNLSRFVRFNAMQVSYCV